MASDQCACVCPPTTELLSCPCMVRQVRRQFAERPGIMTYAEKPDYARCVSIVATSALKVRQTIPAAAPKCKRQFCAHLQMVTTLF